MSPTSRTASVVGSGPNGLVAAITLARAGWQVTVFEAAPRPGGGTRSEELTLPGHVHDVCSAVHPLAVASSAFRELEMPEPGAPTLRAAGLRWVHPTVPLAHPLDGGRAAVLYRSLDDTAAGLGADAGRYRRLVGASVDAGLDLVDGVLDPLAIPPRHPVALARFGVSGVRSATALTRRFVSDDAAALFGGLAGHSMLTLDAPVTGGYGLLLGALAHLVGWPVAEGGSQRIADALVVVLESLGGRVVCDHRIASLRDVPPSDAVLLDVTPRQVLDLADEVLPPRYRRTLERYRYGPGVYKVDWALDGPIPWTNESVADAGTVHLGGTFAEVADAEAQVRRGGHPDRPFVLLAQPSRFDHTRAPAGRHTAWAYCHVPSGSTVDMTSRIEAQVERFAPGFGDRVVARHVMHTGDVERHDENYVGGDINGGVADLRQFVARPRVSLRPWRTPVDGLYLCSSSTPPGGGVHGMCGLHAARTVLRDHP